MDTSVQMGDIPWDVYFLSPDESVLLFFINS